MKKDPRGSRSKVSLNTTPKKDNDTLHTKNPSLKRKTGITIIGDVPWGTHLCQFYQTKDDLIDVLVPYFKAGLENNEFCMWITSEPLYVEEAKKALKSAIKNFDDYINKEQIEILDATEWYTKSGKFDADEVLSGWMEKEEGARKKGFDGLRLSGNTFWLEKKDWKDFTKYEEAINQVIGNYKMIAICSYSLDKCNASEIIDVVSNHQFALIKREGKWHRIEMTEQKKSKQERERQSQILNQVQDGIIGTNHNFQITYWNKGAEQMFGFSEAESLGKNSQDLLHPSYAPGEREKIIDELNRQGKARSRIRIKHRNGTEIIADLNATRITDENENVTGYVVTYRDITKQKHMEDAFKQQHEELQTIFDTVPASIFYKDKENRIIRVNQAFTKLMGLTKEELEGKSLFELYPKEQAEPYWEDDKDVITLGKQKLNIIESVDTKKGLRWVQTHKIPYRDNFGKIIGVVGFTTDITERKQAEEQLREIRDYLENLLNYANAPIIVWDTNSKITRFNHAFEHLTGYTSNEVIGKNLDILFPEESKEKSLQKIKLTLGGEYWESVEIPIQHKDGNIRIALWNSANIYDNQGKNLVATIAQGTDITERKKAEEQLRETRDYLENLLNYANAPIIVWDKDFKIIRFNHAFEHLTGYTSKMMIGKKLDILFPKENKEESLQKINRTLTGEYWESVEISILHKNGDIRVALWNSANIYDDSGKKLLATIAQGQDITERKQIEDKLKESEIRLNRAQELAHLGSWELNPINNQLIWSDEVYRIFGLRPQEFGATYEAFLRSVHPDDRAMVDDAYSKSLREGRDTYEIEHRVVRKNGEVRFVYEKCEHIRDKSGKIIRSVGMVHDITDRKQAEKTLQESEEKYRRIVENTTNVIMVTQPDGIISYLSPSCKEVLGYSPEELIGTNPMIFHPDDTKKVQHVIIQSITMEKKARISNIGFLQKQGKLKWISHSWSPIFIDNKIQSIISVIEDITERKITEENIKKLNENLMRRSIELAVANKELETFSYSVSHDLRAPLRSIDGFSQALLEDYRKCN